YAAAAMAPPPDRRLLEAVAANVARRRIRLGLAQDELAELADVEPRHIQRIERGVSDLGLTVFVAVARALKVAPGNLLRHANLAPAKVGRPRRRARDAAPARRS